eukprot:TRINITY_DN33578_c0_g2_i1.p2 TRINITY_DN33578_c0_g2~~TRINITY_DN33578_c0_g2_i1.p2  ORF type:complete len:109 (+),score=48.49 TRINITY_DN33578_c0_g2_i1:57-383(+)
MSLATTEVACMYAALICEDCAVDKSAANITAACKAAGVTVKSNQAATFEKLLGSIELKDLLSNISAGGGGGGGAAPAAAAGGASAPAAAAAPKEESEEDDDMGFGLFD